MYRENNNKLIFLSPLWDLLQIFELGLDFILKDLQKSLHAPFSIIFWKDLLEYWEMLKCFFKSF